MFKLNIFNEELNKTTKLNEEDLELRRFLEICADRKFKDEEEINRFSVSVYLRAYQEIFKKGFNSDLILDMVNGTHMLDNLDVIKDFIVIDDDEEIY